jgi:hypothetical protein
MRAPSAMVHRDFILRRIMSAPADPEKRRCAKRFSIR